MQNPFANTQFKPDEAFAGAVDRFFEMLKTCGMPAAGKVPDWSSLAAPLASQFEQWLRLSQTAGPWFTATAASPGAAAPPGPAAPGAAGAPGETGPWWSFGLPPLGAAAAQSGDAQRVLELLATLARLQGQLAAHWSEIAGSAARSFVARLGTAATPPATPEQALRLYELWINCAEEAYGARVRREDFSRLQSELANTQAALLLEQRRHTDSLLRTFGMPTRNEVDALHTQLKELRRQLAELAGMPRAGQAADAARPPGRDTNRAAKPKPRAKPAAARASGKRTRARRPRR
jgi:hypothetical protein